MPPKQTLHCMITSIARLVFKPRQKALERYKDEAEALQMQTLLRLTQQARNTEWGVLHGYHRVATYEDFAATGPVNTYEELKG